MHVYLDSCVVIYEIDGAEPWHAMVDAALKAHAEAAFEASDLVRMECRIGPLRRRDEQGLAAFDQFFQRVAILPMPPVVFDLAAELRAVHGLKTPDALHLATALYHGCDEFWTNDDRLSSVTSQIAFRTFA